MAETPYVAAVAAGLDRLERVLIRVWQIVSLLGIVAGLIYAAFISRPLGFACATGSSLFLIWFVVAGHLADRGEAPAFLPHLNAFIEALVPWVFMLAVSASKGADYALASWVPPFLFCSGLVAQVARLRLWAPTILGVSGALVYPTLYWAFVLERVPPSAREFLINQPATQMARSVTLVISGGIATLLVLGLHSVVMGAETAARERELGGKYRLIRDIAAGATGSVYEGEYCPEGGFVRRVAIRRFHPHVAVHDEIMQGFREAADVAQRLAHPNIVQVEDFLRTGGSFFLVLEWVEGVSLDALSRSARATGRGLNPEIVAYLGLELLAGLAHAHTGALGEDGAPLAVVHGDLCPDVVMVSTAGEVKIGGFAVARSLREFNRQSAGHVDYMAPECATGAAGLTSDLYSAGAISWELLLGQRRLVGESTSPTGIRLDLPGEWDAFFARAVADAPASRAESAMELMAMLAAVPRRDAARTRAELAELVAHVRANQAARTGVYDPLGPDGRPGVFG
ncbi:MAG: serine/threonine protein kinase [Myxococcales bacterium]|nr:serine/threonine protein kinase [Myxococcales bacterium]